MILDRLERQIFFVIDAHQVVLAAADRWRDAWIRAALFADIDASLAGVSAAGRQRFGARIRGELSRLSPEQQTGLLFELARGARDMFAQGDGGEEAA